MIHRLIHLSAKPEISPPFPSGTQSISFESEQIMLDSSCNDDLVRPQTLLLLTFATLSITLFDR